MQRVASLRRRFKLVKSRLTDMFARRDSAVVIDDDSATDAVARHRAETEAKLEGRIEPLIPSTQDNDTIPKRHNSRVSRASQSHGVRESVRHSRQSATSQQFVMSAVAAGCGQGLGWSLTDVQTIQHDEPHGHLDESVFREDGHDGHGRNFFVRSTKRKSRFRYSVFDPSAGLGESASHNEDDATHSQQANYIRVMMESGNFDLQQLNLNKVSIDDPHFQTALHAALESFPPGMAANIIEAAAVQQVNLAEEENPIRRGSSLRKSRFSIAVASKTAWHTASKRLSRISTRLDSDIQLYEKPRFSRRIWSRTSWRKKSTDYMAY